MGHVPGAVASQGFYNLQGHWGAKRGVPCGLSAGGEKKQPITKHKGRRTRRKKKSEPDLNAARLKGGRMVENGGLELGSEVFSKEHSDRTACRAMYR